MTDQIVSKNPDTQPAGTGTPPVVTEAGPDKPKDAPCKTETLTPTAKSDSGACATPASGEKPAGDCAK